MYIIIKSYNSNTFTVACGCTPSYLKYIRLHDGHVPVLPEFTSLVNTCIRSPQNLHDPCVYPILLYQ